MNDRRHHAENPELHSFGKCDGFIFPVGGLEIPAFPVRTEKFHREFIVDAGDHDGTVARFEATVDDKDIARTDSCSRHGVARGADSGQKRSRQAGEPAVRSNPAATRYTAPPVTEIPPQPEKPSGALCHIPFVSQFSCDALCVYFSRPLLCVR